MAWFVDMIARVTEIWTSLWLSPCGHRLSVFPMSPSGGRTKAHDDVIKWKHFPRYWPFVRGIHRSPVNSPRKGKWRGALVFSLICAWTNGWFETPWRSLWRRYVNSPWLSLCGGRTKNLQRKSPRSDWVRVVVGQKDQILPQTECMWSQGSVLPPVECNWC